MLAVGARALVTPAPGANAVALCDDHGRPTGASLAADAEVQVVAWLPGGRTGTRYRIRADAEGVEGWVGAASVRAVPVAPAPPRVTKLPPASVPRGGVSARPRGSTR